MIIDRETCNWNEVLAQAWKRRPSGETGTIICITQGRCLSGSVRAARKYRWTHGPLILFPAPASAVSLDGSFWVSAPRPVLEPLA